MKLLIQVMYISIFSIAAFSKFFAGGVPEWFRKQFAGSLLDIFPGALAIQFYGIATVEFVLTAAFAWSFARAEFRKEQASPVLNTALLASAAVFVALGIGLRVTNDFNGAFQLYTYFVGTILIFAALRSTERN